eukprot:3560821-Rhodomonas_salina.2
MQPRKEKKKSNGLENEVTDRPRALFLEVFQHAAPLTLAAPGSSIPDLSTKPRVAACPISVQNLA